ncbi:MAG: sugar phosphate isomerase/epimerase [Lachnospiraceae bacterium]|nr:sugar phosphate isomerase/epimerase [Ruminococcus sp.]MCM1274208.1 sugar phosphate isomerase/epimerase [Lachnospiraceae bacterium]
MKINIGVSTASLYPLHVEDAFAELARLGVKCAEVFANSVREGGEPYISQMCKIRDENGMTVTSFHPFSSPMESVFLFSTYDRRVEEMIELYRGFFGSMNRLGAKVFVVHGAINSSKCTPKHYVEQFRLLSGVGREYGVAVAQENVHYCLSGRLEFLKMMKRELGEDAKFVLDLKQARRSGEDPLDYVEALGESIVHCHLSDGDGDRDCLPVGRGNFDFGLLARRLFSHGYAGAFIVELYRDNYGEFSELKSSVDALSEIVDKLG